MPIQGKRLAKMAYWKIAVIFRGQLISMVNRHLWFCLLIAAPLSSIAGDLSRDVRNGTSDPRASNGNYLEIALSTGVYTNPVYNKLDNGESNEARSTLSIEFNLHLHYRRFFVESFSQSFEQLTFGYKFFENEHWSHDIVSLQQHTDIAGRQSFRPRDGDYMAGMRSTWYSGKYILQAHALTDLSQTHNGQVYSLKIARHWQYKNWNFHAIESLSYRSRRVANYYYSIQPYEVTSEYAAYSADAGFTNAVELGVTYPISQKWVFRSLIRYIELDPQWTASPQISTNHAGMFIGSFSYVF